MDKRVVIANDHGAVELKQQIVTFLEARGYSIDDLGVAAHVSADYPDQAVKACSKFLEGGYEFGIVCCGTGIGISITANKVDGIRCALPQNAFAAEMAKEHNNANFLAFGGRIDYVDSIEEMLTAFIESDFDTGGRHTRRVDKIMKTETL